MSKTKKGGTKMNDLMKLPVIADKDVFAATWLAKRDVALDNAAKVTQVTTDQELEQSGAVQSQIAALVRDLAAERLTLTRPIDALKKQVMDAEKVLSGPLSTEMERVKRMNTVYATEKARLADVERRRHEAEKRAEDERLANEQAERERIARDAARSVFGESATVSSPVELPPAAPVPVFEPRFTAPKTSANAFTKVWKFDVVDAEKVPREFCSVDDQKIRAFLAYQKQLGREIGDVVVAGLQLREEMSVRAR